MAITLNSSGEVADSSTHKVFGLFRLAVDENKALFDHSYLGQRICVAGDTSDEVRAKVHELVDRLFDGFDAQVEMINIDTIINIDTEVPE